jgi:hypothetical protein
VTQLGVATERKFHIRHGLAYEHDALVTSISHSDGHQSSDITGRAVVLAFRMAGVDSAHPRIVAQKQIVDAVRCEGPISIRFRKWRISADDRLRYFKGQKWGTDSIYRSSGPSGREPSIKPLLSRAKRFIRTAEGHPDAEAPATPFAERFLASMLSGPDWAIRSICDFADLIGSVIDPLKHFVEIAESNKGGFDGNGHITN